MEVSELKPGYHIFGNKGAVWSKKCHIAKSGFDSTTLCGIPMLSNNWARLEKETHIGCEKCIERYKELTK